WAPEAGGPRQARVMVLGRCPSLGDWCDYRTLSTRPVRVKGRLTDSPGLVLLRVLEGDFGPGGALHIPADGPLGYRNWHVAHLVRCFDPQAGGKIRANWVRDCLPLLRLELRLVRPDFLLTLGTEATEAVLGKGHGVSSCAGQVFERTIAVHEAEG